MNRIKQLRKEANITLRKLGEYTSVSPTVLTYLNNDKRAIRQVHIEKLCSFFNVTADYLLGKSDNGYIVYLENENDPIILSGEEYQRLGEYITISILQTANKDSSFTIGGKTIYFPKYYIHRELKGDSSQYDLKQTIINRIDNLLLTLNSDELNLLIKFIEEFIKKKK